jgi:hypothetical protein
MAPQFISTTTLTYSFDLVCADVIRAPGIELRGRRPSTRGSQWLPSLSACHYRSDRRKCPFRGMCRCRSRSANPEPIGVDSRTAFASDRARFDRLVMGQVGSQSCGVAVRPAFHRVSGKTPVLGTIETRELLERIV